MSRKQFVVNEVSPRSRGEAVGQPQNPMLRARELWEQNGCPAGRDLEFWLQAEAEIIERNRE